MSDEILERGRKRAEELGLKPWLANRREELGREYVYDANAVYRLLGEGEVLYGLGPNTDDWSQENVKDTHSALLIGIRAALERIICNGPMSVEEHSKRADDIARAALEPQTGEDKT